MYASTTELVVNLQDLEIIRRPLAELKPDPANPRQHSKKQIKQIAESIKAFGFNVPVLVDTELNVLAGHGLVLACREAGIDEVPTVCLEHLTPAQARAFMIADNKLAENATWDDRLLAEQLRDLSLSLDFDIEDTGFEMGEIDMRIESLEDPLAADKTDPADVLPEIAAGPPVSTLGDEWVLGRCVVWQRPRSQRLHRVDGRGTRCDSVYRPPLQRADRGSRGRSWHDPSPPLSNGFRRDGPGRVYGVSPPDLL
jgi:ParB-like chromosome segregation protein Spo0J